jgi:hypothetical protein
MLGFAAALLGAAAFVVPAQALAATNPSQTGFVRNASSLSGSTSVAISGSYAYATGYYSGQVVAVNISNPASPSVAGASPSASSLLNGTNIAISGGFAYVVSKNRNASSSNNDDGTGNSLTILSLANPASPTIVGTLKDATNLFGAYGVAVSGHYAFIAAQGCLSGQPCPKSVGDSFNVVDISNASSPTLVATIKNSALPAPWSGSNALKHATSVAIAGNYAYVTASYSDRLTVVNISSPTNPSIVASLQDGTNLNFDVDVATQGNYAYVADQASGLGRLAVVDISNPSNPTLAGTASSTAFMNGAYRVRVRGNFAYVSGVYSASIGAVDVSKPTSPRFAGGLASSSTLNRTTGLDLDSSGRYVFAVSPYASGESNTTYPPYPGQVGGPTETGTVTGVDLDPAAITVTIAAASKPANPTSSTSANFTFSTNDSVATTQCSLDGASFSPCTSATTATYSGLAGGQHSFTVQAIDSAGKTASDSYTWTISGSGGGGTGSGPTTPVLDNFNRANATTLGSGWSNEDATRFKDFGITSNQAKDAATTYAWDYWNASQFGPDSEAYATIAKAPTGSESVRLAVRNQPGKTNTGYAVQVDATGHWTIQRLNGSASGQIAAGSTQALAVGNAVMIRAVGSTIQGLLLSGGTWTVMVTATDSTYGGSGYVSMEAHTAILDDFGGGTVGTGGGGGGGGGTAAPTNTAVPTISGSATVGSQLTASTGTWTNSPTSYAYQWQSCQGSTCGTVGSNANTYTIASSDTGATIKVTVTASNTGGGNSATSNPTAAVTGSGGGGGGGGGTGTGPTTPVLDTFDRADASTLGSSWSNIDSTRFKDFGIASNQCKDAQASYAWDYWNAAQFGPDSEAYATIAKAPTGSESIRIGVRNQPGTTNTGYAVQVTAGGAWSIQRLNGTATVQIASGSSHTLAAGDKVLIRAVGSTIQGLVFSGGTWTVMVTVSDSTYTGAGYFSMQAHTAVFDDFGGGSI